MLSTIDVYIRQGPRLLRRVTGQGTATLRVHRLGAQPIVRHFLERMNVGGILRGCLGGARQGQIDHGQAIEVVVHNYVLSPGPLYRIADWVAPIEASVFDWSESQKSAVNDDRIARALDALASERGRSVFFRLALRVIKDFKLETQRIHFDTTTVTFSGRYETSRVEPRITFGYNKDHRPDLKQLVFGLNVTADGAVPLLHHVWSGNRTDDNVHRRNTDDLRHLLERDDFIYVADGKLCTADNLRAIADYGGKFVTVLPRTRREDARFRDQLRERAARWKTLLKIPDSRRKDGPPDIYSTCAGPATTDDGYRLIWIRSSQKACLDAQARLDEIRKAEIEIRELSLNRRGLKTARAIRQAVRAILKRRRCEAFLNFSVHRYTETTTRYLRPGRPRPKDPVRAIKQPRWRLKLQRDAEALRRQAHTDGVFPLVTNLPPSKGKRESLLMYKYQPYVEKRFSQLKTELVIAPVFLKKPRRVVGLIHAYFIALALVSLIERQVRLAMRNRKLNSLPLLPEARDTETPTAARILETFSDVSWYEFDRNGETVAFPIALTPLQTQLLELLEVPRTVYP
jgi:transposase